MSGASHTQQAPQKRCPKTALLISILQWLRKDGSEKFEKFFTGFVCQKRSDQMGSKGNANSESTLHNPPPTRPTVGFECIPECASLGGERLILQALVVTASAGSWLWSAARIGVCSLAFRFFEFGVEVSVIRMIPFFSYVNGRRVH
jgi:hypothetical protein